MFSAEFITAVWTTATVGKYNQVGEGHKRAKPIKNTKKSINKMLMTVHSLEIDGTTKG